MPDVSTALLQYKQGRAARPIPLCCYAAGPVQIESLRAGAMGMVVRNAGYLLDEVLLEEDGLLLVSLVWLGGAQGVEVKAQGTQLQSQLLTCCSPAQITPS